MLQLPVRGAFLPSFQGFRALKKERPYRPDLKIWPGLLGTLRADVSSWCQRLPAEGSSVVAVPEATAAEAVA